MKAKRTALIGMLLCLSSAAAFGQIAPNNYGDIGLFTMPTADNPRAGQLTLGFYGWLDQLIAGDLPSDPPWENRAYSHWAVEGSLGLGIMDRWSVFASAGAEHFESRSDWRGGVVNGIPICCEFEDDEARKVRIGTKVNYLAEHDPDLRVAVWLAALIPTSNATIRQDEQGQIEQLNTRRTDWEWGGVVTKDIWTAMVSYQLSGRHDEDVRPANRLRFGVGVDIPILPFLHIIAELDRNILDGGDFPEEDYSMLTSGARFWIGRTGWGLSGAVNTNIDMILHDGFDPFPIGGLVGVHYAKWPPLPPPPVVIPPPAVVTEERTETVVETVTPPPAPRTTVDEIYFDAGSARLTNIAKAILDGVALRMKNDLNSTAIITAYSDNTGTEEANMAISAARAEAAKEYLVTRHGIDPNRIATVAKGSADPAYDNTTPEGRAKNRRAVIVVTLTSGA